MSSPKGNSQREGQSDISHQVKSSVTSFDKMKPPKPEQSPKDKEKK